MNVARLTHQHNHPHPGNFSVDNFVGEGIGAAALSLGFQPGEGPPRALTVNVAVQPINTVMPIRVIFQ